MKRIIYAHLMLLFIVCFFSTAAVSETLVLPNALTVIESEAFFNDQSITTAVLPQGVEEIQSHAFAGSGLETINFPVSLRQIHADAFEGCTDLVAKVIPGSYGHTFCMENGIHYLLEGYTPYTDFSYTSNGESITITKYNNSAAKVMIPPDIDGLPVQVIGRHAFNGKRTLREVTVPEGVTELQSSVFYECYALEKVILPSTLRNMGITVFNECRALDNVVIPEGVTKIGNMMFYHCTALEHITLPSTITLIDSWAFSRCTALQYITLPHGVQTIANSAFQGCQNLLGINFPDTLTTIGQSAFDTTAIGETLIPRSVTNIHSSAFTNNSYFRAKVFKGSYAETFCISAKIPYTVVEETD